jgi:hypothetical protein
LKIEQLDLAGSPRRCGEDPAHIRLLAAAGGALPPITVRRGTMQVIDGRHRVRAALLNGQTVIAARQVDCDDGAAFALAVKENVTHGLPLSLADRKAAAASIIAAHPNWSDRVVAECTGLSDKTVSGLRAAIPANPTEPARLAGVDSRLGKDGRLRPVNPAARRRNAAAMLRDSPDAGLREIARLTGLSPATVGDVRRRIERGEDPVPARYSKAKEPSKVSKPSVAVRSRPPRTRTEPALAVDLAELLGELMKDPSLKFTGTGRRLVCWLRHYAISAESYQGLAESIPDRWALPVARLARGCAAAWVRLAEELESRRCATSVMTDRAV